MIEIVILVLLIANIALSLIVLISGRGKESGFEKTQYILSEGIKSLKEEFVVLRKENGQNARELREEISNSFKSQGDNFRENAKQLSELQQGKLDEFSKQVKGLSESSERSLEKMHSMISKSLEAMREDNSTKLEKMRQTVDEKLHKTLEERLGQSFKLVSDRLEEVHKGLGEMQNLANGVGDLKRVLSNVKTRGTLGEYQLESLLQQLLSPEQYVKNAAVKKNSAARVEFAIKLPGKDEFAEEVLIPVDSKFPTESYQRLLDAKESADKEAVEKAKKEIAASIKSSAKEINSKYINVPYTTDFAVMFIPFEGLYAEVLSSPGLFESIQRDYKIVMTGPVNFTAFLSSLQMGFRTLAIQKRSSEVWKLLGEVKTSFSKFGDALAKTKKKLKEASSTIEDTDKKTQTINRKLAKVEEYTFDETPPSDKLVGDSLLPEDNDDED